MATFGVTIVECVVEIVDGLLDILSFRLCIIILIVYSNFF